ncbi:UNVERIFIED_CONTAM: Slc9a1 [Trichonephila clavipes]
MTIVVCPTTILDTYMSSTTFSFLIHPGSECSNMIHVIDHIMGGIEEVADQFLGNYKMRDRFKYFNNKYLRPFLIKKSAVNEPKIIETHSRLNLIDAVKKLNDQTKVTIEPGQSFSTLVKNYTEVNLRQYPNTFGTVILKRRIRVVVLSFFLNKFRLHPINGVEQFIMSYGGLRGAVAFALALIIDKRIIPSKDMMVTTTIAVVYFTVFVQGKTRNSQYGLVLVQWASLARKAALSMGMTIKFFVRILKVQRKSDKSISMNERLHGTIMMIF